MRRVTGDWGGGIDVGRARCANVRGRVIGGFLRAREAVPGSISLLAGCTNASFSADTSRGCEPSGSTSVRCTSSGGTTIGASGVPDDRAERRSQV